jgi:hypothetical protein
LLSQPSGAVQAEPLGFFDSHCPASHHAVVAQSLAELHVVLQPVAPHA